MATRLTRAKEAELLKDWTKDFLSAWKGSRKWRREKRKWRRFYDGDQLEDREKQILTIRGQPQVVVNRIKPKIDALIGMALGTRVDTKPLIEAQVISKRPNSSLKLLDLSSTTTNLMMQRLMPLRTS